MARYRRIPGEQAEQLHGLVCIIPLGCSFLGSRQRYGGGFPNVINRQTPGRTDWDRLRRRLDESLI